MPLWPRKVHALVAEEMSCHCGQVLLPDEKPVMSYIDVRYDNLLTTNYKT